MNLARGRAPTLQVVLRTRAHSQLNVFHRTENHHTTNSGARILLTACLSLPVLDLNQLSPVGLRHGRTGLGEITNSRSLRC
jgi:hypothetical protein